MYKYLTLFIGVLMSISSFSQSLEKYESFGVTISLPMLNRYTFYKYQEERTTSKTGIIGAGASIFYKHNRYKYSINYASTIDFNFNSFKVGGYNDNIGTEFIEANIHYSVIDKINIIGGVNFSTYQYSGGILSDTSIPYYYTPVNKFDKTIGLTLGAEIAFTNHFSIVAFYRPSLYCFDKKSFKQMISLDFRFDVNLWRKK